MSRTLWRTGMCSFPTLCPKSLNVVQSVYRPLLTAWFLTSWSSFRMFWDRWPWLSLSKICAHNCICVQYLRSYVNFTVVALPYTSFPHARPDNLWADSVIYSRLWSPSFRGHSRLIWTSKALWFWISTSPAPRLPATLLSSSGVCMQNYSCIHINVNSTLQRWCWHFVKPRSSTLSGWEFLKHFLLLKILFFCYGRRR